MAAIANSPRRILGERDVNTQLLTSPSKSTVLRTPGKKAVLSIKDDSALRDGDSENALLSPKLTLKSQSPSSGMKRRAAWVEGPKDGSPRKQIIIGIPDRNKENDIANNVGTKPYALGSSVPRVIIDIVHEEKTGSTQQILRSSPPADSSFDHSLDSDMSFHDSILASSQNSIEESQDTIVTVPDDNMPAVTVPLQLIHTQATPTTFVSVEVVRRNAATLKAKLRLAKYKVKTGQEEIPFEQLKARKLLTIPASRPTCLPSINTKLEETTPRKKSFQPEFSSALSINDSGQVQEHSQTLQRSPPLEDTTGSTNSSQTLSSGSQQAPAPDRVITSIEVEDEVAEGLINLTRRPLESFKVESPSSDGAIELPSPGVPRAAHEQMDDVAQKDDE